MRNNGCCCCQSNASNNLRTKVSAAWAEHVIAFDPTPTKEELLRVLEGCGGGEEGGGLGADGEGGGMPDGVPALPHRWEEARRCLRGITCADIAWQPRARRAGAQADPSAVAVKVRLTVRRPRLPARPPARPSVAFSRVHMPPSHYMPLAFLLRVLLGPCRMLPPRPPAPARPHDAPAQALYFWALACIEINDICWEMEAAGFLTDADKGADRTRTGAAHRYSCGERLDPVRC
jgi:hypothetical protein